MEQGLLTADVEEEEYDALNDETFGADLLDAGDAWEEDHEKFAELDDKVVDTNQIANEYLQEEAYRHYINLNDQYYEIGERDEEKNIEKSIRQLVLDDDVDDPAIMNISRSRPLQMKSNRCTNYSISPPPPAIVESNHVGSPSTNSIWSTTAKSDYSSLTATKANQSINTLLNNLKGTSAADLLTEDPSIISSSNNRKTPPKGSLNPAARLIPNVKTLEEIERDMLLSSQRANPSKQTGAQMVDEVEREILLKPRVRTVSEIERDIASSHAQGMEPTSRTLRTPPGFVNCRTGASLAYLGNGNGLSNITAIARQMATSPLPIPGQKLSGTTSLLGHLSPSPPLLVSSSSVSSSALRPQSPPPFPHMPSHINSVQVRMQQHTTRMIPPQLTAYQRHPYHNQVNPGQQLLVGQLRYPPVVRPGSPLSAGLLAYPHPPPHSRFPISFSDPRQMRRFPQQHQALLQQQQNNQIRARFQPKRNSWSEGSGNPNYYFQNHLRNANEECEDEYANLMSQREKDWLVKIQMMQLQSDNPYLDDYYYTTYSLKKRIKEAKENEKNHEPTLVIPEHSKAELRSYQPAHFEGSLGKLQVMSVNCPRRMIDLDIVHPDDAESETQKVANRELKRYRQLLLEIEKICSHYLEIDDLDKKAAALPEEARIPLFEHKSDILMKIYNDLVHKGSEHLIQIMSVRKGRHLVARSLPLFSSEQANYILSCVFSNFSLVLKRDQQDKVIQLYLNCFSQPISTNSFAQTVELGLKLCNHGDDSPLRGSPSNQRSHYLAALQNKAGATIVFNLIEKAEETYHNENTVDPILNSKWTHVILHIVDVICGLPDSSLVKPKIVPTDLMPHFQRFPIEQSKLDVLKAKLSLLKEKSDESISNK